MRRFRSHWEDQIWKVLRILELANIVIVVSLLGFVLLSAHWAKWPLVASVVVNIVLAGLVLWRSWILGDADAATK